MTFKELEFKKVKELLTPFMDFKVQNGWLYGHLGDYTMFTYYYEHCMCVHFILDFEEQEWDYINCNNYFDVLRLLPKIKETFLEVKHPGYHQKLKRIQDDF